MQCKIILLKETERCCQGPDWRHLAHDNSLHELPYLHVHEKAKGQNDWQPWRDFFLSYHAKYSSFHKFNLELLFHQQWVWVERSGADSCQALHGQFGCDCSAQFLPRNHAQSQQRHEHEWLEKDCLSGIRGSRCWSRLFNTVPTYKFYCMWGLQATNADPYRGTWGGAHCRDSPVQVIYEPFFKFVYHLI